MIANNVRPGHVIVCHVINRGSSTRTLALVVSGPMINRTHDETLVEFLVLIGPTGEPSLHSVYFGRRSSVEVLA